MPTIADIKKDAESHMKKSVEALKTELQKLRTGRASAALLDHLRIDYYGSPVPISQVANVTVTDSRTLTVTPWEKGMVGPVEKAIMTSDLSLTPNTSGQVIRIVLPALTEQRRKELAKVVSHEGENSKVAVRNIRREANQRIKELLKAKLITEDEDRKSEEDIQKLTDDYIKKADQIGTDKEKELLSI